MSSLEILLPPEILSEIFQATLAASSDSARNRPFQYTLCSVSKYWRDVAQSSPELWCNISIPFLCIPPADICRWTRTWMARSGSCPIYFRMHVQMEASLKYREAIQAIFTLLSDYAHQLAFLSIKLPRSQEADITFLSKLSEMAHLRELYLCFYEQGNRHFSIHSDLVSFLAPLWSNRIRHLRLSGVNTISPLWQLVSLDICGLEPLYLSFQEFANASPSLKVLVFRLLKPMLGAPLECITMPSVVSFTVSCARAIPTQGHPARSLLQHISLPNLERLEIGGSHVPFDLLLQGSAGLPKLRTLRLTEFFDRTSTFPRLFSSLSIKELHLVHTRGTEIIPHVANPGWLELEALLLDSIDASEVLWLCKLLAARSQVKTVYLSRRVMLHLSTSLQIVNGKLCPVPSSVNSHRLDWQEPRLVVSDWIRAKVSVQNLHPDHGIEWETGELNYVA